MAAYCAAAGVRLAPHGKTTMAPQLFARQLAAGAWAVTAATVGELHVCREFGIPRVLLANELTDPAGATWLAGELAARPGFECYVYADSLAGVRLLDEAVRQASPGRPLSVLVELGYPGAARAAATWPRPRRSRAPWRRQIRCGWPAWRDTRARSGTTAA